MSMKNERGELCSEEICIGHTDPNECTATGKSSTRYPKSHVFSYMGGKLRLIDTPGIGDTDGPEQDAENFQRVLAYVANLPEIHGICILLKPNNARLTTLFKYCIYELLSHLHRDAAKNILFCFTNSRSSFYMPGEGNHLWSAVVGIGYTVGKCK